MNNLLSTLTNNTPLPMELWLKIIYKHKGFITPSALLIKNHFEKITPSALLIKKYMKKHDLMPYTQIAYYVRYENLRVSESVIDMSDYHITANLEDIDDQYGDNKYSDLWLEDYDKHAWIKDEPVNYLVM
tara:strand:+ start:86 stop:475 length:390 start_codon:yes stop_codon:yes gene_type:complete